MIDRSTGAGLLVVAWTDEEAALRTDTLVDDVRTEAMRRFGTAFPRTETYAMVRTS